jgi:hypothetical protein
MCARKDGRWLFGRSGVRPEKYCRDGLHSRLLVWRRSNEGRVVFEHRRHTFLRSLRVCPDGGELRRGERAIRERLELHGTKQARGRV